MAIFWSKLDEGVRSSFVTLGEAYSSILTAFDRDPGKQTDLIRGFSNGRFDVMADRIEKMLNCRLVLGPTYEEECISTSSGLLFDSFKQRMKSAEKLKFKVPAILETEQFSDLVGSLDDDVIEDSRNAVVVSSTFPLWNFQIVELMNFMDTVTPFEMQYILHYEIEKSLSVLSDLAIKMGKKIPNIYTILDFKDVDLFETMTNYSLTRFMRELDGVLKAYCPSFCTCIILLNYDRLHHCLWKGLEVALDILPVINCEQKGDRFKFSKNYTRILMVKNGDELKGVSRYSATSKTWADLFNPQEIHTFCNQKSPVTEKLMNDQTLHNATVTDLVGKDYDESTRRRLRMDDNPKCRVRKPSDWVSSFKEFDKRCRSIPGLQELIPTGDPFLDAIEEMKLNERNPISKRIWRLSCETIKWGLDSEELQKFCDENLVNLGDTMMKAYQKERALLPEWSKVDWLADHPTTVCRHCDRTECPDDNYDCRRIGIDARCATEANPAMPLDDRMQARLSQVQSKLDLVPANASGLKLHMDYHNRRQPPETSFTAPGGLAVPSKLLNRRMFVESHPTFDL
eukprot:Gregarina_sp_Poly_1__5188@NODE_274_length_10212_cov_70_754460_g239_i0_p2_GENE_NODE_274_length_10212_cov_70_754460_g239_i0NODE_274_length_10212_cov_70_754460_g239_i0_p2_ORF_typecomplete_len569_score78_50CRAL_TRIO/PF00650_20/0_007_NODE_274_length_10212_cov_70_754460_g239_i029724678